MDEKTYKNIFLIVLICVALLSINRFLIFIITFFQKEAILFDFFGRNFLEHFFWGIGLPTFFIVLYLEIKSKLGRKRDNKSWNFIYFFSLAVFIVCDTLYYYAKQGILSTDWIKFILGDILGFVLGILLIFKFKKDTQKNN